MTDRTNPGPILDGLAADIASSVLREIAIDAAGDEPGTGAPERPGGGPDPDLEYKCTGSRFDCSECYGCVGTDHSCADDFRCGHFTVT